MPGKDKSDDLIMEEDVDPKKSDFVKISSETFTTLNIKIAVFLFFIGMVIFSDVFISNILVKIPDSTEGESTTTKGTIAQLTIFVLMYLLVDLIVQKKWL